MFIYICILSMIRYVQIGMGGDFMGKLKQLILGFIIGGLIFGGIPVVASSGAKNIEVTYDNIKIALDGKVAQTDAEPFRYQGLTYVPLRFISESLGATVNWNTQTKTVEITSKSPASSSVTQSQPQPTSPPTIKSEPQQTEKKEVIVYITKTGEKYHQDGCRYLSKSRIPINLSDAKSQGYTPCSVCNPPR